ncbi:MAG: cyclic nucleotide-binding domain-containing protein, partial [Leptospiraceae bacterium]|nr:cyclic nucleotide-binding domain-containing protein [Leptospiraceae bacterium]
MQECQFIAGEVIFNEGEESDVAYQVISGRVDIYRRVPGGTVQLGTVEEGEIFGEMGIISDTPRSACAAALTDVTLRAISCQTLDLLLERQPEIIVQIIRVL